MKDEFGRTIDYIRISIIDRCNLRCVYCMPEEGIRQVPHSQILTFDEITRLAGIFSSLGIRKVKITGGEPLVRKGCPQLIGLLKSVPGIEAVTITTNGTLLAQNMPALAAAGLDAVNISLDTLNRKEFARITRRDELPAVLRGIESALSYPDIPVKINCVPLDTDESMLLQLALLARDYPVQVRFIEMMPIGLGASFKLRSQGELTALFENAFGPLTPVTEKLGNGPGRYYHAQGFLGNIGFISAITHQFCDQCNRVRLTSEGYLKACLQFNTGADLRQLLRGGASDKVLRDAVSQVIMRKPKEHHFQQLDREAGTLPGPDQGTPDSDLWKAAMASADESQDEQRIMSQIGG